MDVRHSRLGRLVALTVVLAMPLVGLAGVASAAPVGSATWCAHHPHLAKTTYKAICAAATGTGTGGTGPAGGDPPNLIVSASPDPVPEVGTSEADFVVQVETLAVFANQTVTISSQQLNLDVPHGYVEEQRLGCDAQCNHRHLDDHRHGHRADPPSHAGQRWQRHRGSPGRELRPGDRPRRGRPDQGAVHHGDHGADAQPADPASAPRLVCPQVARRQKSVCQPSRHLRTPRLRRATEAPATRPPRSTSTSSSRRTRRMPRAWWKCIPSS